MSVIGAAAARKYVGKAWSMLTYDGIEGFLELLQADVLRPFQGLLDGQRRSHQAEFPPSRTAGRCIPLVADHCGKAVIHGGVGQSFVGISFIRKHDVGPEHGCDIRQRVE